MKRKIHALTALIAVLAVLIAANSFTLSAAAATSSSKAGIVSTVSTPLNVRTAASYSGTKITELPKGSYITLISNSGGWWKVEYASEKYGYVSAVYITAVSGSYAAAVNATALNVRSGAGTSYAIKAVLYNGKTVVVLSSANGWYRILYNGTQTGYVSSKYIGSAPAAAAMLWPVPASTRINQYYAAGTHKGIDIGASVRGVTGDKIIASSAGTVAYSGWFSGYGNVVYINSVVNGQNIQTRYAHMNTPSPLKTGMAVSAGQLVGYMGSTGTSSGVHLHFEVRLRVSGGACVANADSTPVDPFNYVKL